MIARQSTTYQNSHALDGADVNEWGPALAIILGIVEGLTEFLPVSSTGHLILAGHAFGFTGDAAANAEISIQLGAILAVEVTKRTGRVMSLEQVSPIHAVWIGLAQCASLIPGMSRSGSTIIGGLLVGLDRKVATEYSFFLALPTIIAATVYETWKAKATFTEQDFLALGIGMLVSFLVAWAVIAAFLTYVQRHTLRVFAYYRIMLGVVVLLVFH
jgi:undecaprenyl-diphosphatase